jgi:hypothetical protein
MFKKMQHWVNKEKLKKNLLNEEAGGKGAGGKGEIKITFLPSAPLPFISIRLVE